jgi:hypothetical protein
MKKANQIEELPGEEGLIDKPEVARRVRKTTRTIDDWMAKGFLPYIKMPGGRRGTVLFKWSHVLAALEKFRIN